MNKESDGERAVRVALDNLGIKYEQEKEIHFLKEDFKDNRRADFFLSNYNVYIEYLGGWDKKDKEERNKERQRYNEKIIAYKSNGIKCIWIFPNQLNYVSTVIKKGLEKLGNKVEPLPFYKNPLIIAITTIIALILFSSISLHTFFTLIIINIVLIVIFIMTRCPKCKRVFVKVHASRESERIEKRPWEWRVETKYLYSDGSYKNSTFSEWRKRIERVKIFKNIKECKKCSYKWTEKEEVNLDSPSRPPTFYTKRTSYRNPTKNNYRRTKSNLEI